MTSRATAARRRATRGPLNAKPRAERQWLQRLPIWIAQAMLLAVVLLAPWAFAGVRAGFQSWCFVAIAVALICWAVSLPRERNGKQPLPVALAPMLLGLALGGLQLMPIGHSLRQLISPQSTAWRDRLAGPAPRQLPPSEMPLVLGPPAKATQQPSGALPLSIDATSSRRQLALLVMAVGAFSLGARFFRHRRAQALLCLAAAGNGAAIAVLGIAQRISGNYSYLGYAEGSPGGAFGSFFNENNAAGYLSMCLACGLAGLYWMIAPRRPSSDELFADGIPLELQPASSWRRLLIKLVRAVGSLKASTLALGMVLALLVAGVLCSLSRGAWLALAIAAVATVVITRRRKELTTLYWSVGLAGVSASALLAWLGITSLIERRWTTLLRLGGLLSDARLSNWAEALRSLSDHWLLGSGLGTYGYAYLPYQQQYNNSWHLHAENQYVEALIDGGAVGLLLLLVQIALVLAAVWKIFTSRDEKGSAGLVSGCLLLLLCQAVHGLVDFGLYLPANFLLLAAVSGSFCGRAALLEKPIARRWRLSLVAMPGSAFLSPLLVVGLAMASVLAWQETTKAASVESALAAVNWDENSRQQPIANVEHGIERLSSAVQDRWHDGNAQLRLAQLWIQLYRLHAFDGLKRQLPGRTDEQLWRLTDLAVLHARAAELASVNNVAQLQQLRHDPLVADYLGPAWQHLLWARQACPWLAETHLDLAVLSFLSGAPSADQVHLADVHLLAGYDPSYLYAAGLLNLDDGRDADAYREFKTSWTISLRHHYDIITVVRQRLTMAQMLDQVIPASPEIMIKMARETYSAPEYARERQLLLRRAEQLLASQPMELPDKLHAQAGVELLKNDLPRAFADFRRASELRPTDTVWRNDWLRLAPRLQPRGQLGDIEHSSSTAAVDNHRPAEPPMGNLP